MQPAADSLLNTRQGLTRCMCALGILLCFAICGAGQPSPSPQPTPFSGGTPNEQAKLAGERPKLDSLIQITLRTSRPQISAGSGFGIVADIQNKSDQSVYLLPKYLTMTPPPEIEAGGSTVWWALMPPQDGEQMNYERIIHLGPGGQTTAFWSGYQPAHKQAHWWEQTFKLLFFPPGEYTIKVVGSYWTDLDSADKKLANYRTETADIKVLVAAPQWVILIGSVIGGLIAYFLLPTVRLNPRRIELLGLGTAVLFSAIVTILLARLSETQFLIRVTINDFWGAIAIGFIACASGTSILQKFLGKRGITNQKKPGGAGWWLRRKRRSQRRKKALEKQERPATE